MDESQSQAADLSTKRLDTGATSRIRFLDRLQGSVEELASGMESEQDVVSVYLFKIFTIILILGQTVTPFG